MKDKITILIPTSPIPSHPSTEILDETIANIRKYTDAHIVIMCDGIHPSLEHRRKDYQEYKNCVSNKYLKNDLNNQFTFMWCGAHAHQAEMTRHALRHVTTPLILFCEHDTSPIGEIPFDEICEVVQNSQTINCVRFNIFDRIIPEHEHLMLEEVVENSIKMRRTIQWSQRPHIAKTSWYKNIINQYFPEGQKTMIEDVMHGAVQTSYEELGHDIFGLAIYTPDGNQLRSYHSDGRGADTKIIEA